MSPNAQALASGCIAAALLDVLYKKGVLDLTESRDVLRQALNALAPFTHTTEGFEATKVVTSLMSGPYTERR